MKLTAESTVFNDERIAEDISNAQATADETAQYFWFVGTGTDTGVHITEKPQEQFREDPENGGGNLLARSNGVKIRDGLTELAEFNANGVTINQGGEVVASFGSTARIGKEDEYNLGISSGGFSFKDGDEERLKISSSVGGGGSLASSIIESKTDYSHAYIEAETDMDGTAGDSSTITIKAQGEDGGLPLTRIMGQRTRGQAWVQIDANYSSSPLRANLRLFSGYSGSDIQMTAEQILISLSTNTSSGTDHDLYAAITALGWQSDVIE